MAARPEANNNQVPGSGTVPEDPLPHFFLFPVSAVQPQSSVGTFLFDGEQRPAGNGGGAMGIHVPPTNGLYKLNGSKGPRPGISGRLSNAD